MNSLIVGASGQVGALLYDMCSLQEECVGTYRSQAISGLRRLDLGDTEAVGRLVREVRPDVCYLPAACTFVDHAETHPDECLRTNVAGVANLARCLASVGSLLVFFSTDHVFGDHPRARDEEEPVEPLSVYARSKVSGEQVIRDLLPGQHLILRTSWVFGPDRQEKNFLFRVRRTLGRGERLVVASDQHGQPTYGPDLAWTARELVTRKERGTFHVVGPQELSRLAWAHLLAEELGLLTSLIQGRPTAELPPMAPRPLQIQLARNKLLRVYGTDPIRSPRDGIRDLVQQWTQEPVPAC